MFREKINIKIVLILVFSSVLLGLSYNAFNPKGVSYIYKNIEYSTLDTLKQDETNNNPLLITLEDAVEFYDNKEIIFIDARDKWDFAEGHIKGAINIPEYKFETEETTPIEYDKEKEYVIYCGGDDCDISKRLAEKLKNIGFKRLYIYTGGFNEWEQSELPVEYE